MNPFDQSGFDARFEWGENALGVLLPTTEIIVVVDVLSFSTAVDIAVARGAVVLPFPSRDAAAAAAFADREQANLAVRRGVARSADSNQVAYSLSPVSLQHIPAGTRLVLPSPNGSTLSRLAAEGGGTVFAGCLRNASAVASAARALGRTIGVIAAGERWPDDSLRPAVEDLVGAGAILSALGAGAPSPEAELAVAAFEHARADLGRFLVGCASGRELIESGYAEDVRLAAELDVSATAPVLDPGAGVFLAYPRTA